MCVCLITIECVRVLYAVNYEIPYLPLSPQFLLRAI